ncbi:diguanylate cyclase [Sulfurospirillum barnesii]|uniref:PAS domain S-box/diguanylate cyclase (GGDEF) domain-containing protein n=1 Tax=Sulfurospirillum barnesii (strain ATCC 700032 / DSM 10660 / SES-3) TaxID=760154 RepID=I3XZQ4_SULBS|nr:diguanylate cyclase [Sulfurospirillum barnesii]AFL69428.1 PAS domain S-box/diguanylate cyclase (GGDEF) domain-containing protein [Sulfurospirillum barnesii SES-3]
MGLRGKLFIFMGVIFIFFSLSIWMYSSSLLNHINEKWAERFIKKQMIFDKNRTLLPLLYEVDIAKEMAKEPAILAMALDDTNPVIREEGLKVLEAYRLKYYGHTYFAGFAKSNYYYFNDSHYRYDGTESQYILSAFNPNDRWFFDMLLEKSEYRIHVNMDEAAGGKTFVWVNVPIRHEGHIIGVVGTGLDFNRFMLESVGIEQEGVKTFFTNHEFMIQAQRSATMPTPEKREASYQSRENIETLFTHPLDRKKMRETAQYLKEHPSEIVTFWVEYEGVKKHLGMSYLEDLEWFNFTLIDEKELEVFRSFSLFPILCFLFLMVLSIVGFALNILILKPIQELQRAMGRVEQGDYAIDVSPVGSSEIRELSEHFITMIHYVRRNNEALEEKVKERTQGLRESEAKLNTILDSVEAFIYIKDTQYRYMYANKKTCELFGIGLEGLIGKEDDDFFEEESAKNIRMYDEEVIEYGRKVTREESNTDRITQQKRTYLSTKIPLRNANGMIYALCGISTDISERKKIEEVIHDLAYHDALTRLPNRRMFNEQFALILAQAKRQKNHGALMVIDLDNFKPLNDTFGHHAGDVLLMEVARRLKACVREVDFVGRFGGDEFIVVLGNLSEDKERAKEEAMQIGAKIRLHVSQPYSIALEEDGLQKTITHHCTASIGVRLFGHKKEHKEQLFVQADSAMYQAKQNGRNRIEFYEEENV